MQAHAAEAGAGHAAAFYTTPEFWVAVAFVIFVVLAFKPIFRVIATALDDRAETIRNQLNEARRLREEAQELLASYQRRQREAAEEADQIVAHAQAEAERIRVRAEEELRHGLKRREELAMERIAQAEAKALAEVKGMAADLALAAAERVLAESMSAERADALLDAAIGDLARKLN